MEDRLTEIETKLAWQDDLLDALNKTVSLQQKQIDQMEKICRMLIERLKEVTDLLDSQQQAGGAVDEKPPHY